MKSVLLMLIYAYQKHISPTSRPRCRYVPSCSSYAYEAIETHGALIGAALGFFRVLRCNPFSKGGFDPVPPSGFHRLW